MVVRFVLSEYVERAMAQAVYDELQDESFSGRIPRCPGVLAFGSTLRDCSEALGSTLQDWILVGLQLGHRLPVIGKDRTSEPHRRRP